MGTRRILDAGKSNGNASGGGNVPATRENGSDGGVAPARPQRADAQPANVELVEQALASSRALGEFIRDASERARFAIIARNFYRDRLRDKAPRVAESWMAVDPTNYALACLDAARDGLVPDGRQGYMIPRGKSVDWQPSWKGLLILARRHNKSIEDIAIEIVYRQEIEAGCFRADLTTRKLEHVPWYSSPEAIALLKRDDRGMTIPPDEMDIAACYCIATVRTNDGRTTRPFRVLSIHELVKRAEASGSPSDRNFSAAWNTWFESMARAKTFKAWCDWIEMPTDMLDVITRDDERELARVEQQQQRAAAVVEAPSLASKVRGTRAISAAPLAHEDREPEPSADPPDEREPGDDPDEPHDAETGEVADAHA